MSARRLGAGEVDPTGGGFLVQVDFVAAIYMIAHDMGKILGAVNKIPIGEKFNGIKIPAVDETSRATGSRWGGVQSYWIDEGTGPSPTKPKFRILEWSLHKLMSFAYMTDELLAGRRRAFGGHEPGIFGRSRVHDRGRDHRGLRLRPAEWHPSRRQCRDRAEPARCFRCCRATPAR